MNKLLATTNPLSNEKMHQHDAEHLYIQAYTVFKDYCFQIALGITKCRQASEDISQDVFLKLWSQKEQLCDIKNIKAFVGIAARNNSINYLRKQKLAHLYMDVITSNQGFYFDLHEQLEKKNTEQLLQLAILSLSPQRRTVFVLGWLQGLKREQIAGELGVSPHTVKNLMQQARHQIRQYFTMHTGQKRVSVLKMMKHVWHPHKTTRVA